MGLSKWTALLDDYRNSFVFKIFGAFVAVIFVVLSFFSVLQAYQETLTVKKHLIKKGEVISRFLAGSLKTAVFAENKEALENVIGGVISEEEVISVSIYSPEWNVIYETQRKAKKADKADFYRDAIAGLHSSKATKIIERPDVIDCLTPISLDVFPNALESLYFEKSNDYPQEKIIGYVRVGLDKTLMTKEIKTVFLRVLVLAIFFIFSGAAIIYVAVKKVSTPLIKLTENVRMLGIEGNAEKIDLKSDDEIGKLADAFNKMAEDLRRREYEKKALEEELINAKKMEALGTLSRGIAHDFNNILSTIQGASFLLKKKLDHGSPLQQYVNKIYSSLARADNLIQSLITFSRGQTMRPVPVNINTLVNNFIPYCEKLPDDNTKCNVSLCDRDLMVLCDQTRIEQVLLNLVSNARDAMPEGGLLSIRTDAVVIGPEKAQFLTPGAAYALISVSDTGTGIPDDILERIFEPFFTTKETGKGTGLGLSIAYGIVRQYNGLIEVYTQPGKATTLDVYLPLI
jgi:signal transduction histidine kinase